MSSESQCKFIYLTQEEVLDTGLNMDIAISRVEKTLSLHSRDEVVLPSKVVLDLGEKEIGRINAMPAYVGGDIDICGIKWIGGFPGNPADFDLPRASALIVLNSSSTGFPVCEMDGTFISALRTGASTGVGAKYLAKENSSSMGIIGCGVQAITQLKAIKAVFPELDEVKAFDIDETAANNYKTLMESEFPELQIRTVQSPEKAVKKSDIVVTVTVADEPIVKDRWLKPGVFFSHVGSYQEEEEEVILNADKVVLDEWEQVLHRKTPLVARLYLEDRITDEKLHGDIGEIINGDKLGRESPEERIFYSPIGLGTEDIAVAHWVYRKAKELKMGKSLQLWKEPALHIPQNSGGG